MPTCFTVFFLWKAFRDIFNNADKKFLPFEGNWYVSDNDTNALGPLTIALYANESSPPGNEVFEFDSSGTVYIELAPVKKTIRSSELRGTYSVPESAVEVRNLIGSEGRFSFSFSPFTTGTSFTGTFFPEKSSGIPQLSFAASRSGGNPLRAKIVERLNFKGKRKAGKSITVLNQYINRGKGTVVVGNKANAFIVVEGDFDSVELLSNRSKGLLMEDCETQIAVGQRFVAQCPIEYLGPPSKSTNALLAYKLGLADSSGGTTLVLQSSVIGSQIDSGAKTVKLKIGGGKKNEDEEPKADGFYTGTWECSGYGEMSLTHKKNKITAGSFSSNQSSDAWFPPGNGEVGSNIVTLETRSATMKLVQNFGGFTQIDVVMASDNASFSGNAIFADASSKVSGSAKISCVRK